MTIARRMAIGYAWISLACLCLVAWLGYHEFIKEPAEFAELGIQDVHKDTGAELATVSFLGLTPVLLAIGWWWMRRVLAPLEGLADAVQELDPQNLPKTFPTYGNGDEVGKLSAAFNVMAARLEASFRRIHEFTLHASHELKTPLTIMRAQLETALRESGPLSPDQNALIDGQLDEVRRLTRIVDSLTLLTKADTGLVELEHNPVALHTLVEEALENAEVLAHPAGIHVNLDICNPVTVTGDRDRLRQLLLILCDNAVKYNQADGHLEIALKNHGERAELTITNTACELGPSALENAFEPFIRGTNAKTDGCGLGLTIAKWIVHAHHGEIRLRAIGPDKVAATVILPVR